jgi:thiol-disulfide isomerase/thioredoxin
VETADVLSHRAGKKRVFVPVLDGAVEFIRQFRQAVELKPYRLLKILEPLKGKFVLLDIWGTWCGPCKEALSHSTEEYARLKDYDIEFLYLANNSPTTSWENVIKEYNVSGDNVTHYNLPREQQSAIESYLGINAYPTYKLFDREGNLLDIKVDARNLDYLESLLQSME